MTTPDTPTTTDNGGAASPSEVARQWASSVSERDSEQLAVLYEVGAALHIEGDVVLGPANIAATLLERAASPGAESTIESDKHGWVNLTWGSSDDGDDDDDSTRMHVRRGQIVEQWIGGHHSATRGLASTPMELSTSGELSSDDHDLVWDMLDHLVKLRDEQAILVDARLENHPEQRRPDPVALRVTIRLIGGSVRASARAADVRAAVQVVQRRLTEALRRRADQRTKTRTQRGTAQPSGPDSTASSPAGHLQRPPSEREIVRHKSVSPGPSTLEEATFDLVSMDYDFFLYLDIDTNDDTLVARVGDDSFAEHRDPPITSAASARERLDVGNEPFVFFRNQDTERGNVLYRRLDGHYGLIVPSDT